MNRTPIIAGAASVATATAASGFYIVQGDQLSQVLPPVLGFAIPYSVLGAFLVATGRARRMGWALIGPGAAFSGVLLVSAYASFATRGRSEELPFGHLAGWLAEWSWVTPIIFIALVILLFPTGHPPTPRWKWVQRLLVGTVCLGLPVAGASLWPIRGQLPTPPGTSTDELAVSPVADIAFAAILLAAAIGWLAAIGALIVRFRRASNEERHQLKWFVLAAIVTLLTVVQLFVLNVPEVISQTLVGVGLVCLPVAMTIAILKYRLYDIDVVISKTVVFAGLAAFITAIYVSIVVGVGTLLGAGGEPNLALSIVATAVVAVAFQPVRERLTRLANRLVFGRRATPYEVLSRFSSHLGETVATEDTLEKMARLLADGTGAAHAQVSLVIGGQMVPAASVGQVADASAEAHTVEVTHQGETLGALSVTKKRGETLTPGDVKLVDDLAAQAGLLLRNVRLTEELKAKIVDLRASRQRLVAAQDQERRRLERDLHDGAQQQIVAMKLKLGIAKTLAERENAPKTVELVEQLMDETDDAVQTLRELAHGIYPPLLAAQGLTSAISTAARRAPVPVTVHTDGVGRYDQDVEAAVYFCVLEAITNAAKYANPTQVVVRLGERTGELIFEVVDDGAGFDPTVTPKGHGTTNMTDRLDALHGRLTIESEPGSGTSITGRLPTASEAVVT